MKSQQIIERLEKLGVIIPGHFVLSSGLHCDRYLDFESAERDTFFLRDLCCLLGGKIRSANLKPEVIVGPKEGSRLIVNNLACDLTSVARLVNSDRDVFAVMAVKHGGDGFVIRPNDARLLEGKQVLVADDVFTTGRSVRLVARAVRGCGGVVIGAAAVINRGQITAETIELPWLGTLVEIAIKTDDPRSCPKCLAGEDPNVDLGHGREFLAATRQGVQVD